MIKDSARFGSRIVDLGRLWGHLKEGYGRLIASYAKLVVQKINFHQKVSKAQSYTYTTQSKVMHVASADFSFDGITCCADAKLQGPIAYAYIHTYIY